MKPQIRLLKDTDQKIYPITSVNAIVSEDGEDFASVIHDIKITTDQLSQLYGTIINLRNVCVWENE